MFGYAKLKLSVRLYSKYEWKKYLLMFSKFCRLGKKLILVTCLLLKPWSKKIFTINRYARAYFLVNYVKHMNHVKHVQAWAGQGWSHPATINA
jgi:hypothetical protein